MSEHEQAYQGDEITFFAHDWVGVPLFWAMTLDPLRLKKLSTIYFAHETRVCRMLVEGNIKDKMAAIEQSCHPDGHDVSFYAYLTELEKKGLSGGLDDAFATVKQWAVGSPFPRAFQDIYYHEINRQAERFDKIVVVGKNVERETRFILADGRKKLDISVCPNGVPNFIHAKCAKSLKKNPSSTDLESERNAANDRLKRFASKHFGFSLEKPIYLVTSVSRCELSKAPWRNLEFFKALAAHPDTGQALFIWLSRPRPLPTPSDIARWQQASPIWPLAHRPKGNGGDLREEEEVLWEMIDNFNSHSKNCKILYVNQFGWDKTRLGEFDLCGTTFDDLRIGTDIELGLSVYEPFGIAPLEPYGSGTICVLSDACGCAVQLEQLASLGTIARQGFVVGAFAQTSANPKSVNLRELKRIEDSVYKAMIAELFTKLAVPSSIRLHAAQESITKLSWDVSSDNLLRFLVQVNERD